MKICLWLSFLPGVTHLKRIGPPRIGSNTTERFLRENSTLEIRCTGGVALEWIYPEAVRSRVSLSSQACPTCDSNAHFTSTLTVRSARPQDSGQFQCIYSRYVDHINNATAAEINIFVAADSEFFNYPFIWDKYFLVQELIVDSNMHFSAFLFSLISFITHLHD